MSPKFLEPYRVTRIRRNNRYIVEKIGEHEESRHTNTAADFIKHWPQHRGVDPDMDIPGDWDSDYDDNPSIENDVESGKAECGIEERIELD